MSAYSLPDLPYDYAALEPAIIGKIPSCITPSTGPGSAASMLGVRSCARPAARGGLAGSACPPGARLLAPDAPGAWPPREGLPYGDTVDRRPGGRPAVVDRGLGGVKTRLADLAGHGVTDVPEPGQAPARPAQLDVVAAARALTRPGPALRRLATAQHARTPGRPPGSADLALAAVVCVHPSVHHPSENISNEEEPSPIMKSLHPAVPHPGVERKARSQVRRGCSPTSQQTRELRGYFLLGVSCGEGASPCGPGRVCGQRPGEGTGPSAWTPRQGRWPSWPSPRPL